MYMSELITVMIAVLGQQPTEQGLSHELIEWFIVVCLWLYKPRPRYILRYIVA